MATELKMYRSTALETQLFEIEVWVEERQDGSFEERISLRVIDGAVTKSSLTDIAKMSATLENWVDVISAETDG